MNNENNYSQEEYKKMFYKPMSSDELEKIHDLNLADKIKELTTSTYQIKYLNDIGYVFIGEGYLILSDGTEPTHYFVKILTSKEEAIQEIEKEYSEKVKK